MRSFSHILNTVSRKENEALFSLQKITLDSFAVAKAHCNAGVSVEVIAVHNVSVQDAAYADKSVLLKRAVTDVGHFNTKLNLPLISDILELGVTAASGEYVVFTNTDIILTPWFYNAVSAFLEKGHDALVINRRRIPARLKNEPYEVMLAHAGYEHIGFDCFIFRRSLFEKFVRSGICIGIPMAGNDIFHNIFTFAENPALLANQHLTFHLGLDLVKEWGPREYVQHNKTEFRKLLAALEPHMLIARFPGAGLPFFKRHFRWLMNPTYDYRTMCRVDFRQRSAERPEAYPKEIPGLGHRYYEWLQTKVNFREKD